VLDPDCIRHIEVDDHYLVITAGSEAIRVIGRLSEAAAQLDGRGMTVHRSHWLAFEEFGAISRHGRAFRMTTKSGGQVPISRERWRDVKRIAEEGAGTA
jgi:DNA-binding LytR/AlgR family response regulator